MLNEYDEYYCDHCGHQVSSAEVVFWHTLELCDSCYEGHYE